MRIMDNFRGQRAQSHFTNNTPIHNTYIKLHHHSYKSGRFVARTRLCTYIHAACNKCRFQIQ
jgi:hypothetical protein